MKQKFVLPDTLVLLFSVIVVCAILTWIIPGGEYDREERDERTVVIPGSFKNIDSNPQNVDALFMAPLKGFIEVAYIIVFIMVMGGVFGIIQATGAFTAMIHLIVIKHEHSKFLQKASIPILMIIFSLAGATFGMSEETIPFVLIFVPLALSLGYDSIVGTAIPYIGAHVGFAAAFLNPFTVGIAQGISELPLFSGIEYRIFTWVVVTTVAIIFVTKYAKKIKSKPELSPTYKLDTGKRKDLTIDINSETAFSTRQKLVLVLFGISIIFLVVGVIKWKWYTNEIAAMFFGFGILCGVVGKLSPNRISKEFVAGSRDLILTAFVVAFARGILIVAQDGKIIDTILYYLTLLVSDLPAILSVQFMLIIQSCLNFFVPSGSGQAALTIPILSPLSDLIGITRQTTVLAFQFGDGFSNMIIPTSGVLMGALGFAKIDWGTWAKWMIKMQIVLLITAMALLIPPVLFKWGPF
jgi:uncharacterized ion transporter superfamily protein YfcC